MKVRCNFHFRLVYTLKFEVLDSSVSARVSDFSLHELFAFIRHRPVVLFQGGINQFSGGSVPLRTRQHEKFDQ